MIELRSVKALGIGLNPIATAKGKLNEKWALYFD
jgi:hypothetical protein